MTGFERVDEVEVGQQPGDLVAVDDREVAQAGHRVASAAGPSVDDHVECERGGR